MPEADTVADALPSHAGDAPRGVVVIAGADGPAAVPAPLWFDGARLWTAVLTSPLGVRAARGSRPCVVYLPPAGAAAQPGGWSGLGDGADGDTGLLVRGRARVFGLADPVGLALHGTAISAALAALAARHVDVVADCLQQAARSPLACATAGRCVVRVTTEGAESIQHPRGQQGLTPRLPAAVPASIRRQLAGRRDVVAAVDTGDDLVVAPAAWGPQLALRSSGAVDLPAGRPAAVTIEAQPGGPPGRAVGMTLFGELDDHHRLRPTRASWWQGATRGSATIEAPPSGGVALPD